MSFHRFPLSLRAILLGTVVCGGLAAPLTGAAQTQQQPNAADAAAPTTSKGQTDALKNEEKANKQRAKAAHEQRKALRAQDKAAKAEKKANQAQPQ